MALLSDLQGHLRGDFQAEGRANPKTRGDKCGHRKNLEKPGCSNQKKVTVPISQGDGAAGSPLDHRGRR